MTVQQAGRERVEGGGMARHSREMRRQGRAPEIVSIPVAKLRRLIELLDERSPLWGAQFGSYSKAEILTRLARIEMNNHTVLAAVREPDGSLRLRL